MKKQLRLAQFDDMATAEQLTVSPDALLTISTNALAESVQDYLMATVAARESPSEASVTMLMEQLRDLATTVTVCIDATHGWVATLANEEGRL
jgi:hypothetical protein